MVTPGETNTTTVPLPHPPFRRLSEDDTGMPSGRTPQKRNLFKNDLKYILGKGVLSENSSHFFSHGLIRLQHFSSNSPVRFLMFSEDAEALMSLHSDNTVSLYSAHGYKETIPAHLPFLGLTATKISGCVVGWGPGAIFTLLDRELRPLDAAHNGLDIRVCQAAEQSTELVTAGAGNVCVWSVMLMRCKLKIQDGLQQRILTHLSLAPPRSDRHHRAFVTCGETVTVVDLDDGKVLTQRSDLSGGITAMVYCVPLDCLIIASKDLRMTVWSPDLEPRGAFCGLKSVVNSLFYCPEMSVLMSSSEDGTICCWNMKNWDLIQCIHTDQDTPPLYIGGARGGDTFFSFSHRGLDIWTFRSLYSLHCPLAGDKGSPLRQIVVSPLPLPYPTRVLCVSGDSDVTVVAVETGAVLTSFKAEDKILCADYCLHKETLVALTESGTVLQANTLTNPSTLMQEWKGIGQRPWQGTDCLKEHVDIPDPPCCLVLYRNVTDTQRALDEWRDLQARRGCSHRGKAALHDAKNKFLIILGHSGGCLSVLKVDSGDVICRMPAHVGQKVTRMKVYPENSYLLSTGEDLAVAVWKVRPFIDECLILLLSLPCAQPQVYFAALGSQMAFTSEDPDSYSYVLRHFSLLRNTQTDSQPRKGHLDRFTGLCVVPELKVFVSSSLDKTLRIWNEKNQLVRTLQLNAVPECLAYSGFGGELFLGVKGNLCKINCAHFLPRSYQQMVPHTVCPAPPPDLLILNQRKTLTASIGEQGESQADKQPSTEDKRQKKDSLMTSSMDLEELLQGKVKCNKMKPPRTKQTRKEAFDRYMKIIYGLTPNNKISLEDILEPGTFSFHPKPKSSRPLNPPRLKADAYSPAKSSLPETVEPKKKSTPSTLKDIKPVEKVVLEKNKPQLVEKKPPTIPVIREPVITEKDEEPPERICKIEQSKPSTPVFHRTPTPAPPRDPSPEVPVFLKQFAGVDWFMDLYPAKKSIPNTISPEDFSLQLLTYLQTCSVSSRMKILSALQALHSQGLFQNVEKLYQGLVDCVQRLARPHMSPVDRAALIKMLNLLVSLKPPSCELIKLLLTLLAHKNLGLRETLLRMLREFGVGGAEEWLWPELESWEEELQEQSNPWTSLHCHADSWLELWISKYKDHNQYSRLRSTAKPTVNVVDVLNHFCSVQKDKSKKARHVAPARQNNTVLMPLYNCSYKPILRLGETYTMARIRKPGLSLPPLRNRPFLMRIPPLISFPLSRITLIPFHNYSDEDWLKASAQRYFHHQESLVEYYRS